MSTSGRLDAFRLILGGLAAAATALGSLSFAHGGPGAVLVDHRGAEPVLYGFGASRAAFAAHKVADRSPQLPRGCCFLPRQRDGRDRYHLAMYDERGRAHGYSLAFAPNVSVAAARRQIRRELPADARLVFAVRKSRCELLQYRSETLARVLRDGGAVDAALYSSTAEHPYDGRTVTTIILQSGIPGERSVLC